MDEKEYTGSCYIAVVGNEMEDGRARDSIEAIIRRKKDTPPIFLRMTKGYEARQAHLNNWYDNTKHPFILFLDSDMIFMPETLERLRRHKKAYVSGLYMRRQILPMVPIWFEENERGTMPIKPMAAAIPDNRLFKIGASGWGCVLIHRDVVTVMKAILKGEPEIIEDDMDVLPYDLKRIMHTLDLMDGVVDKRLVMDIELIKMHIQTLREEIRPLRGVKDPVGSDIRFPFYARLAGYDMYGDSGVTADHILHYPLSPSDYVQQPASIVRDTVLAIHEQTVKETNRIRVAQ